MAAESARLGAVVIVRGLKKKIGAREFRTARP